MGRLRPDRRKTMVPAMPLLLALALAAQPPAAAPLVTRHPDGSVTIERRIEAEPPRLRELTHGLAEGDWERRKKPKKRERDAEFEADLREAFEEAVDWARASTAGLKGRRLTGAGRARTPAA